MILIKIVVEDYVDHIAPYHLKLLADPTGFRNPRWYRNNWMPIEFNLLYRWHSLVPSAPASATVTSPSRTRCPTPTRSSSWDWAPALRTPRTSGRGASAY